MAPAADEVLVSEPLPGKGETQLRLNVPQAAAPAQLAGTVPQNHVALLQSKQATCRKKRHDCPRPLQSTTPDYSRRDSNSSSEIPTSQLSSCKKNGDSAICAEETCANGRPRSRRLSRSWEPEPRKMAPSKLTKHQLRKVKNLPEGFRTKDRCHTCCGNRIPYLLHNLIWRSASKIGLHKEKLIQSRLGMPKTTPKGLGFRPQGSKKEEKFSKSSPCKLGREPSARLGLLAFILKSEVQGPHTLRRVGRFLRARRLTRPMQERVLLLRLPQLPA